MPSASYDALEEAFNLPDAVPGAQVIYADLPVRHRAMLVGLARRSGRTMADVIREALDARLGLT